MVLAQKYPYHFDNDVKLTILLGIIIILYIEVFLPLNPNKYFDIIYAVISVILIFFNSTQNLSFYIFTLWGSLLLIVFFIKRNSHTDIIFSLVIPIFLTILFIYPIIRFFSWSFLVVILFINVSGTIFNVIHETKEAILGIICVLIAAYTLASLNYFSIIEASIMSIIFIISIYLKIHLTWKDHDYSESLLRICLSLIMLI